MGRTSNSDLEYAKLARTLIAPSRVDECLRKLEESSSDLRGLLLQKGYLSAAQAEELDVRGGWRAAAEKDDSLLGRPLADLVGETLAGVRLQRILARGASGYVFAGVDSADMPVTVKILAPSLAQNAEVCRRFSGEAHALSRLRHDNIVRVFEAGIDRGLHYTVKEYVAGKPLSDIVMQRGKLPLTEVLKLGREVALGLQPAHAEEIFHCDIKPQNILILPRGRLKIADFGRAHIRGTSHLFTQSGAVTGAPHYMSPEQCRGARIDGRSDIYSLAVTMFWAATGQWPFDAERITDIIDQHLNMPPPTLRSLLPDAPASVEELLLRCLAKEPEQRFQDVASLVSELEELIGENVLRELGIDPELADNDPRFWNSDETTTIDMPPQAPVQPIPAAPEAGGWFWLGLVALLAAGIGVAWWQGWLVL